MLRSSSALSENFFLFLSCTEKIVVSHFMKKKIFLLLFLSLNLCCIARLSAQQKNLDDYLQSAIKFSPVFIDNANQLQSLALDSMLIRAALKPQVSFVSNDMYAPVINGYGYDAAITNGANVNALLGVNYTLLGRKNLSTQYGTIFLQQEILKLNLKLSARDLKQSVEQQFITVYGEQQSLRDDAEILDLLKKEEEILKMLAQSAVYNQIDYLNFLVSYNQRKLAYSQKLLTARSDFYTLNYLCGIADTTYFVLSPPQLNLAEKYFVKQSTSFQQLSFDSLRIKNEMDKIKFTYRPKLSVAGDAGYNSSLAIHPEKNFGVSAGLNFSVPIYDGKQRNLQQQKLQLQQNTFQAKRNYFITQFEIKQSQLKSQLVLTESLINDAQQQLTLSKTLIDANKQLLNSGDLRIADFLLSVSDYLNAQSTITQLQVNRLQIISQLNYFTQ